MAKTEKYLEGLTIHKVPYNIANTSDFKTNVMEKAADNELFIITDTPTFSLKIGNVTYDGTSNVSATTATQSVSGLMSAADKKKLDGIATGANKTIVDTTLSDSSTNPVQNKVIKTELDGKLDKTGGTLTGNLTGKYITGTWLQTTASTDLGRAPGKIAVLDDSGWVYYRTPAEIKSDIGADAVVITFHGRWNETDNSIVFSSTSTPYDDIQALLAAGKTPELSIQNDYGDWEAKFYLSRDGDGQYQFFSYEHKMDGTPLLSCITVLNDNSAIWRGIDLDNKLDCSGGAMTGQLTLNSTLILRSATYGDTLPSSGVAGQVFFKKA